MRRLAPFFVLAWILACFPPSPVFAEDAPQRSSSQATTSQDAQDDRPIGSESGKKGGVYTVGRGFKKAGGEMEKGFKAAGRGIEKGGKATGRGFKKAGGAIKGFFTGEGGGEKKEEGKK